MNLLYLSDIKLQKKKQERKIDYLLSVDSSTQFDPSHFSKSRDATEDPCGRKLSITSLLFSNGSENGCKQPPSTVLTIKIEN